MTLLLIFLLVQGIACGSTCTTPEQTFDYIIVGGGTAGLVLANRLSSDPTTSIAVIEAGDTVYDNPNVTSVYTFGLGLESAINWNYTSAPQLYTGNRTLSYSGGKALGGTTTINGMTYLRAEKEQLDSWEELGNEGWNWNSLWPYYLNYESFQPPNEIQKQGGAAFDEENHGFSGEVAVGWSKYFMTQGVYDILRETSEAMGYPINKDANGGRMRGFTTWPFTLNSSQNIREDAARAYYYPIADSRPNLQIFLNATATRIIWSDSKSSDNSRAVACGIKVVTSDNTAMSLYTAGELIVSAGSIRSPALLEHSGVGNPDILEPLGIKPIIPLRGVGSNLQDQPNTLITYASPTNWTGYPSFVSYLTAEDLFGSDLPSLTKEVYANLSQYAATIVRDLPPNSTTPEIQEELLRLQAAQIFQPNSTVPLAELLWAPGPQSISIAFWNLLPFARGSIHISSSDPLVQPSIDPKFFQLPIDTYLQAAAAIKVREYFSTPPLSEHVIGEISPNFTTVPENASWRDDKWRNWIWSSYGSNNHPVATCAMMSERLDGIVDGEGRLYGSENVRVMDASIMPMQISGHLSATVYAMAERIAERILKRGAEIRRN